MEYIYYYNLFPPSPTKKGGGGAEVPADSYRLVPTLGRKTLFSKLTYVKRPYKNL